MELEQLSQSVRNSYCVAAAADEGQLERVSSETRSWPPVETPPPQPCVSEEVEVEVEVTPPGLLSDLPPRCCLHAAEFWWVVQKSSDTAVKQVRTPHLPLVPRLGQSAARHSPSSRGKDMSREPMAGWLRASFYWLRGSVSSRRLQPGLETGDLPSGLHLGEENKMRAGLSNCGFTNFQKIMGIRDF